MKNYLPHVTALVLLSFLSSYRLSAQGTDNYGAGLKINLDTSGKKVCAVFNLASGVGALR